MAVLGGGAVLVLSGGTASPLVVGGAALAGAGSAGVATVAINVSGDADDDFDGVLGNGFSGGARRVLAGRSAPRRCRPCDPPPGWPEAWRPPRSPPTRPASSPPGGLDLLLDERFEGPVHGVAGGISHATGLASLGYSISKAGRAWINDPRSVEEQIRALDPRVSRQRQERHISGRAPWQKDRGGYVTSLDQAQEVLDAVRSGRAEVLGRTKTGRRVGPLRRGDRFRHEPAPAAVQRADQHLLHQGAVESQCRAHQPRRPSAMTEDLPVWHQWENRCVSQMAEALFGWIAPTMLAIALESHYEEETIDLYFALSELTPHREAAHRVHRRGHRGVGGHLGANASVGRRP